MEQFFLKLISDALISGSLAFIAVILPFSGALWMYKKGIGANAEIEIFQIGREIATELRTASQVLSPLAMEAEHLIDEGIRDTNELNRDLAIHELLVDAFGVVLRLKYSAERAACAKTIIAIATSRFGSLVPHGIQWSGRGPTYNTFGDEISTDDQLFPFGTKLYRKWIENFSLTYNDLWVCTGILIRHDLVRLFSSDSKGWSEDDVSAWLDHVANTMARLIKLHSKLITQVQIIDNSVNERYQAFNLLACGAWIILLFLVGYVTPSFLLEIESLGYLNLAALFVSAIAIVCVVVFRVAIKSPQNSDFYEQRQAILPTILQSLDKMARGTANLRRDRIDNMLSLKHELRLPESLCALLKECGELTDTYNGFVEQLTVDVSALLDDLIQKFPTEKANIGGFGLAIPELVDQEYDFESVRMRIISDEQRNLFVQSRFQSSCRDTYVVNLAKLDKDQRAELADSLSQIRSTGRTLDSYKNYDASWSRLAQKLAVLDRSISQLTRKSHLDLVARWAAPRD